MSKHSLTSYTSMTTRRIRKRHWWRAELFAWLLIAFVTPATGQDNVGVLTVREAIARSLEASTRVRQADARQDAALAAASTLASEYVPNAAITATSLYSQHPLTVTSIREEGVFPALDDQIHELSLNLSWTVFDFGRGRAARKSAQALAEAAGVQYDLARMETVERVTTAYVRLSQLEAVRKARQERVDALHERRTELTALHDEGRVPDVELLRIAEVILTAETDLRQTENDLSAVLLDLSGELNVPETLVLKDVVLFPLTDRGGVPAVNSPNSPASPGVMLARMNLEAARYSAREATRSSLPAFELFAAERLRSGGDFSFDGELYGGIRVNVPLFQPRQRVRRQVEQATVRERESALRTAEREYDIAARDLANREREAFERAAASEARVNHLEETYRIEAAAHEEGRLTLSDLLDTEARLAAARGEVAAARAHAFTIRLNRSVLAGTLTPSRALYLIGIEG